MKGIVFDLKAELGMQLQPDCTVGNAFGQAEKLGVRSGWKVHSIASGIDQPILVSSSTNIAETLQLLRSRGCTRCVISFSVPGSGLNHNSNVSETQPPLSPNMKNAMMMAGVWFFLKLIAGNTANEWLSSILAFSVCGVVAVWISG